MKKMNELIVEMHEGCLNGVYSVNPTLHRVVSYESGDIYNDEALACFWRNNLLVERGCVSDISRDITSEEPMEIPLRMGGKQISDFEKLFADNPVAQEKLNFLEGFLYAWATVNQKISALCRSADGGKRIKGRELYKIFEPTIQSWLDTYDKLFNELWECANINGEE